MDGIIGSIEISISNKIPDGWLLCDGRAIKKSSNNSLFEVIGNTYGGNNDSFNLPDLRGRFPLGAGQGLGLSKHDIGENGGEENVTLKIEHIPSHTHELVGINGTGDVIVPTGNFLTGNNAKSYKKVPTGTDKITSLHQDSISSVGSNMPHNNMPPYTTVNFIICCQGTLLRNT